MLANNLCSGGISKFWPKSDILAKNRHFTRANFCCIHRIILNCNLFPHTIKWSIKTDDVKQLTICLWCKWWVIMCDVTISILKATLKFFNFHFKFNFFHFKFRSFIRPLSFSRQFFAQVGQIGLFTEFSKNGQNVIHHQLGALYQRFLYNTGGRLWVRARNMYGPSTFLFCRPIFPQKICRPSSFAQKSFNYRISFSSKINLKMNTNRKNPKQFWPVLKNTKKVSPVFCKKCFLARPVVSVYTVDSTVGYA